MLLTDLLFIAFSAFLIEPRIISPGWFHPHSMPWALLCGSLRKCPTGLLIAPSYRFAYSLISQRLFSIEVPSSQIGLACVKLTYHLPAHLILILKTYICICWSVCGFAHVGIVHTETRRRALESSGAEVTAAVSHLIGGRWEQNLGSRREQRSP